MRTPAPTSSWFDKFRAHDPCGNIPKHTIQSSGIPGLRDGRVVANPEYERCKARRLSELMGPRPGSPCDSLSKYADPSPFPMRLGGPPPKLNPEYVECRAAEGIRVYYRRDPKDRFGTLPPKLVEEPMGPRPIVSEGPSMTVVPQQAEAQQRAEAMAQKAAKSSSEIPMWVFLAAGAAMLLLASGGKKSTGVPRGFRDEGRIKSLERDLDNELEMRRPDSRKIRRLEGQLDREYAKPRARR